VLVILSHSAKELRDISS